MTPEERSHKAGIRLSEIAAEYKQYRTDLTDKAALKLAMLANPNLAESYLGRPVRRDRVNAVIKFLHGYPVSFNDV